MDFAQLRDRDGGINLRRVEARVSEQFLDHAEVRAVLQKVRGACVAEEVAASGLVDLRGFDGFPDPLESAEF